MGYGNFLYNELMKDANYILFGKLQIVVSKSNDAPYTIYVQNGENTSTKIVSREKENAVGIFILVFENLVEEVTENE